MDALCRKLGGPLRSGRCQVEKNLTPARKRIPGLGEGGGGDCPGHSPSLYQLSYSGSSSICQIKKKLFFGTGCSDFMTAIYTAHVVMCCLLMSCSMTSCSKI
jgi:hypothetical protein